MVRIRLPPPAQTIGPSREIRVTPEHCGEGRPSLLREAEIVLPAMEPVDRGETSGSGCQVGRPLGGNLVSGVSRRVFKGGPAALAIGCTANCRIRQERDPAGLRCVTPRVSGSRWPFPRRCATAAPGLAGAYRYRSTPILARSRHAPGSTAWHPLGHSSCMATLPPQASAFLQLGVEPIGLGPPVLPRHATLEI